MKNSKKLLFGQAKDPTVIDEELIRKELGKTGESNANFNEVKALSLSYDSKLLFLPFLVS